MRMVLCACHICFCGCTVCFGARWLGPTVCLSQPLAYQVQPSTELAPFITFRKIEQGCWVLQVVFSVDRVGGLWCRQTWQAFLGVHACRGLAAMQGTWAACLLSLSRLQNTGSETITVWLMNLVGLCLVGVVCLVGIGRS